MMKDILIEIYDVLSRDDFIKDKVNIKKNIKFNEYPDIKTLKDPVIIIDDLSDPFPEKHADDEIIAFSYLVQIDVFTKVFNNTNARILRNDISNRISEVLKDKLNMGIISSNRPEYDDEFKIYRSAKRYEGVYLIEKMEE